MNIKKKISFFALFLISSFFIVGEVKGYYCSTNGTICVDSSGTSVGSRAKLTPGRLSTLEEDWVHSYRITLVKQDGTKVAGPKNVYFDNNFQNTNYHYNTYKFSDSFNVDKPANGKISSLYVSHSESSDKEYFEYIKNQITNYIKGTNTTFVKNLGFAQTINNYIEKNEYLFAIVEKNYEIAFSSTPNESATPISYSKMCETDVYKQRYKDLGGDVAYACDNSRGEYVNSPNTPAFYEVYIDRTINYYVGTGSEIARLIEYVSKRNFVPKTNYFASDVWNLKFSSDGGSLELFGKKLMVDENGLDLEFTQLKQIAPSCRGDDLTCIYNTSYGYAYGLIRVKAASGCNSQADANSMGLDWDFSSNTCCKEGTYYKHAVGNKKNGACCPNSTDEYDKLQGCVTKGTCTKDNHNRLNKDWNSKKNVCCNVGELFNGTDCTTKAAPTVSGIKTVYNFTTINSINTCTSNGVNSLISNFVKKSASKTQNGKNVKINPKEADFLLYNNKYKVIFNKETLYCNEKLETQFDGFTKNFGNLFSGKFILLKELPTISKTVSCYIVDPNAGTSNGKNSVGASYVNKVSKIGINFNFLGGKYNYKYLFKSPTATTPDGVKTEVGTTSYNVKYTKFSATINYQFSEISINNKSVENKNINILTAKNLNSISTIMQENKTYKTIDSLSIQIPTDIPTGTYTNSISLTNLDNALEKIKNQDPSHYSFAKSNPNGNCIFKYTIKGTDIDNCGEKYRSAIKTPISASFGVSYTGKFDSKTKECNFTITLSSSSANLMTQDLCKSYKTLPGVSGIPQVSFNSASNTTEIYFKNESVSGDPTKSCKFNINIKDYELVFRPISLSDPFPGFNGKGRTPNSKVWTTSNIDTYIKKRQDAYTKKPLYSVTLTPSQIINIRKYNKTHKYDDFNLKCVGFKLVNGKLTETGKACYSGFIRTYLNTNKSVCANTNDQSEAKFNSCADYSKRQ